MQFTYRQVKHLHWESCFQFNRIPLKDSSILIIITVTLAIITIFILFVTGARSSYFGFIHLFTVCRYPIACCRQVIQKSSKIRYEYITSFHSHIDKQKFANLPFCEYFAWMINLLYWYLESLNILSALLSWMITLTVPT